LTSWRLKVGWESFKAWEDDLLISHATGEILGEFGLEDDYSD